MPVLSTRKTTKIRTRNVQNKLKTGKLYPVGREIERYGQVILGVREATWNGEGKNKRKNVDIFGQTEGDINQSRVAFL